MTEKSPFSFEIKVVGSVIASSEEEARERIEEELDIDGEGRRDYLETLFLGGEPMDEVIDNREEGPQNGK